jgi:hypothetical protein
VTKETERKKERKHNWKIKIKGKKLCRNVLLNGLGPIQ